MKNADREQTIAAMNEWMQEKDVAALYSSRERTEDELRTYELMDKALALLEAQEWVSVDERLPDAGLVERLLDLLKSVGHHGIDVGYGEHQIGIYEVKEAQLLYGEVATLTGQPDNNT